VDPRGVARGVEGGEGRARPPHPLTVVEVHEHLGGLELELLPGQELAQAPARAGGVGEHVVVAGVAVHGQPGVGGGEHAPQAADVVDVAVGEEEGDEGEVVLGQAAHDGPRVGWGVDDDALAARPAGGHDPAVRAGQPQR